MNWIDINEQLPDFDMTILGLNIEGCQVSGRIFYIFSDEGIKPVFIEDSTGKEVLITHWSKLPPLKPQKTHRKWQY